MKNVHFYTLSEQTPIIAIINNKREKNEGKHQKSVINRYNLGWNRGISRSSYPEKFFMKHFSKFTGNNCAGVSFSWNFRPWDLQLHWKVTPAKVLSVNFAKFLRWPIFKNIWERLLLNQLCIRCIPFWSLFRGEQVWTLFEDNPWMFWRVICTCEAQYYKINYKHEGCKFTKTKVVLFSYFFSSYVTI